MKTYYNIYRVIRSILVTGLISIVSIYTMLYILLSLPSIQERIKKIGESELSKLLHTEVSIGSVSIAPFNQVVVNDLLVPDEKGDTVLSVKKVGAGVSLYNLIAKRRIVFTYAEIISLDGRLSKTTPSSPLNIQFIIDALSSKDKTKPPTKFDIRIYNIAIRKSKVTYDILSEPNDTTKFDKNHIEIDDLKADFYIPSLKNNEYFVDIKRLALKEKCGFQLNSLSLIAEITDKSLSVKNFKIELPNSLITPEDISMKYSSLKNLKREIADIPISLNIPNSYITFADFKGFVPKLANFIDPMNITLAIRGNLHNIYIPVLSVNTQNKRISLDVSGEISGLAKKNKINIDFPHIDITADANEISKITSNFAVLTHKAQRIIANSGNIRLDGSIKGNLNKVQFIGKTFTSLGSVNMNASFSQDSISSIKRFKGKVSTSNFNVGRLLDKSQLIGEVGFNLDINGAINKKQLNGDIKGDIKFVDFKNYRYKNIAANVKIEKNKYTGNVKLADENIDVDIDGLALLDGAKSKFDIVVRANTINLAALNLYHKFPDKKLSFFIDASINGNNIDNVNGDVFVNGLEFVDESGVGPKVDYISLSADSKEIPQKIQIASNILSGELVGKYNFRGLANAFKRIIAKALPSIIPALPVMKDEKENIFDFNLKILPNNELLTFFKSPVLILSPVVINGNFNSVSQECNLGVNAPYLQQKNNVIEGSSINLTMNGEKEIFALNAKTLYPNKNGNIAINLDVNAANDQADTDISWWMDRKQAYNGKINFAALFNKDEEGKLNSSISLNPTQVVFNDTAWNILPAKINIVGRDVNVDKFEVRCGEQFIKIDGRASDNADALLAVDLMDINLDYIFETLNIPNVNFGGRATGHFVASNLYTKMPTLATPNLHVKNFSYNNAILGTADIESHWNNSTKGIAINADIKNSGGYTSSVNGAIYPTMDSLYLDFNTNKLDIKFLQPFMVAFTSDISGSASGHGTLFGDFKRINFKGDIFADNLKMKIDYLNTVYSCSDSVHIVPDDISLNNIVLKDKFGNTANLNGHIRHQAFHNAIFDLSITNANNFLCYDIGPNAKSNWYGTIFGNGSAFITGEPGVVNINVNMSMATNSKFTFVLSNSQAANDYDFITIKDRTIRQSVEVIDSVPEIVKQLRKKKIEEKGTPSQLNLTLQIEATPQAQMILVMDPVGGDRIKATGSGNLRLAYNSLDDNLNILGKYTLEKGSYNFTLQDIIIKDFSIKEGSSISFHGDPMAANLDISAVYALNANLTDLDQSFALDKDLNRTNVPVHAVLNATGDISQPSIGFDLEFPTLTQDAYRKIKSIVSTEDMMNRQIIYLVALNRFYTPDYMGTTNNTNSEFASVASSTISSQLANLLGQISDKWTISPNFRTNKGDFSDVEVDVALSSQLLNNRLLLNGNFGYRDKSLNANSSTFIGDFDIEYLLTKGGNIRFKAYNHYNDQNYYVKSALTTQGIGVVFKHDFENLFNIFRKKPKLNLFPQKRDSLLYQRKEVNDTLPIEK